MKILKQYLQENPNHYQGYVDPRFQSVAHLFSRLQDARLAYGGAACVLYFQSEKVVDIYITKAELGTSEVFSYRGLASDLGDLYCEPPSEISSELKLKTGIMQVVERRQNCSEGDKLVDKSIILNRSRQLVGLLFVLHPAHETATIRYDPI